MEDLEAATGEYLIVMDWFIGSCLVLGLGASIWYIVWGKPLKKPIFQPEADQQMLFMSAALDVNDKLSRGLAVRMDARSIEIAKADGRFLVTPEDMRQAYQEIIREEHM